MSHRGWGPTSNESSEREIAGRGTTRSVDRDLWWEANDTIRFYGLFFLASTKLGDAITTAIGVQYVPGIVELNPVAETVFLNNGTITGLVVLSFVTIASVTLITEWLAVTIRLRYGFDRAALLSKTVIYGTLSTLFGWIAVKNSLLISQQVQAYLTDLFVVTA